jgi:hypothetical protein
MTLNSGFTEVAHFSLLDGYEETLSKVGAIQDNTSLSRALSRSPSWVLDQQLESKLFKTALEKL